MREPTRRAAPRPSRRPLVRTRRGASLMLVVLMAAAMGALVLGAIQLTSTASLLSRAYDREADYKYAADAAVAIGKSRLNHDALALPDTGVVTLLSGGALEGADGRPVPGLLVDVYAGPSQSTTGQFGRFASVVSVARDARGARFVRRLELTQESFARFAYWTNRETMTDGTPILFAGGDQLWGPVWSNDRIQIGTGGATFNDEVGTASTIVNAGAGTFRKGYQERQDPIALPVSRQLDRLAGFAAAGRLRFDAPTNGSETAVRLRLEFLTLDLNADGDSTDGDEGFLRVYEASPSALPNGTTAAQWLRGDYSEYNCGAFYDFRPNATLTNRTAGPVERRFFPVVAHRDNQWMESLLANDVRYYGAAPNRTTFADTIVRKSAAQVMTLPGARCLLGGDPRLVAVERAGRPGYAAADWQKGGDDTTFTASGNYGAWRIWGDTVYTPLRQLTTATGTARWRHLEDVRRLHPLGRQANPSTMGVIHVDGTAGVSGVLRGKVTVHSDANLVILDDLRYATDPSATDPLRQTGRCADVLGLLAERNVVVADNAVNTPSAPPSGTIRNLDDSPQLLLHAVVMAMQSSFYVENWAAGPTNVNGCQTSRTGRGCLTLVGGLIQDRRGAVGTSSGSGYVKRYSYDRCAAVSPPPYFPTTGRFLDNRYQEVDPAGFDVRTFFAQMTPRY